MANPRTTGDMDRPKKIRPTAETLGTKVKQLIDTTTLNAGMPEAEGIALGAEICEELAIGYRQREMELEDLEELPDAFEGAGDDFDD